MHIHQLQYVDFNGGDCVLWKVIFNGEFSVTTGTHTKYAIGRADYCKTSPNGPLITWTDTNPLYDTNRIDCCHWETHINSNHNFQFCRGFSNLASKTVIWNGPFDIYLIIWKMCELICISQDQAFWHFLLPL